MKKHEDNKNGVKARKKKIQTKWSMHKGPRHHLLVPSQYMEGRPRVKVFKGCGLAVRIKKGSILEFPLVRVHFFVTLRPKDPGPK